MGTNEEENERARLVLPDGLHHAFIGIHEGADTHSEWEFMDGSEVSQFFWDDGEPNDSHVEGEDCVHLDKDGRWNDIHCNRLSPFICSYDIDYSPETTESTTSEPNYETEPKHGAGNVAAAILLPILFVILVLAICYGAKTWRLSREVNEHNDLDINLTIPRAHFGNDLGASSY